jgi:hypothetical protein
MIPSNVETQKLPTVECAACALPIVVNSVPENGICPGCGGSFFATPRVVAAAQPRVVVRAVPVTKVSKSRTGVWAAVCGGVIFCGAVGFFAMKRPGDEPRANPPAPVVPVASVLPPVQVPAVQRFIPVGFGAAATADTRIGLFRSQSVSVDRLHPAKFGPVNVEGVPFDLPDPAKSPTGKNAIALKGGFGFAKTGYPIRVEIPLDGVAIRRLHVLNAGGGWAWPWLPVPGPSPATGEKAVKFTLKLADGTTESSELLNGVAIADHNYKNPLPGAKSVEGLLLGGKLVRYATFEFAGKEKATVLVVEGFDNQIVPILLAITAERMP